MHKHIQTKHSIRFADCSYRFNIFFKGPTFIAADNDDDNDDDVWLRGLGPGTDTVLLNGDRALNPVPLTCAASGSLVVGDIGIVAVSCDDDDDFDNDNAEVDEDEDDELEERVEHGEES